MPWWATTAIIGSFEQGADLEQDDILSVLIEQIQAVVPELAARAITAEDSMADLGVDSMERGEIILNTLEALGRAIPLVQLHGPRNLGELAGLIHAKSRA